MRQGRSEKAEAKQGYKGNTRMREHLKFLFNANLCNSTLLSCITPHRQRFPSITEVSARGYTCYTNTITRAFSQRIKHWMPPFDSHFMSAFKRTRRRVRRIKRGTRQSHLAQNSVARIRRPFLSLSLSFSLCVPLRVHRPGRPGLAKRQASCV